MELREKIQICMMCNNCKRDHRGVVCGLTDEKPTFETECENFVENPVEAEKVSHMAYQWQKNANNLPGSVILLINAIFACTNIVLYAFLGLIVSAYETGFGPYFAVICFASSIGAFFYFYIWHLAKRKKSYISYIVGTGVCGLEILGSLPVLVSLTFDLPTFFGACIGFVVHCVLFAILLKNVISEKMFKQATRPTGAEIVSIVMGGVIALSYLISLIL